VDATGGVMGKMIDAQSIVVATAATGQGAGREDPNSTCRAEARSGARFPTLLITGPFQARAS